MNNIDKIFCINLKESKDRKQLFSERFKELVNSNIFQWFETDRDSENPKRGCFNSHMSIIKYSKEHNFKNIIIFEDDANLLVSWEEFVNNVNNIKRPNDWSIIMLGYLPIKTKPLSDNLIIVNCAYMTHSYMVSVDKINLLDFEDKEIDVVLTCNGISLKDHIKNPFVKLNNNNIYAIYPPQIRQDSKKSTISNFHDITGNYDGSREFFVSISNKINLIHFITFIFIFIFLFFVFVFLNYKKLYKELKLFYIIFFVVLIIFISIIIQEN